MLFQTSLKTTSVSGAVDAPSLTGIAGPVTSKPAASALGDKSWEDEH